MSTSTLHPATPFEETRLLLSRRVCRRAIQAADAAITSLARKGSRWVPKTRTTRAADDARFNALAEVLFYDLEFRPAYRPEKAAKLRLSVVTTLEAMKGWLVDEALAAQGEAGSPWL